VIAITLWQPYAGLIACGHKTVETRSWAPPPSLIGERIAIHAAKRKPKRDEWLAVFECCEHLRPIDKHPIAAQCDPITGRGWQDNIVLGAVVATARLARAGRVHYRSRTHAHYEAIRRPGRCRDSQEYREPVCRCGDFGLGRYLWLLADIQPLPKPIPARGHQGLWELDLAVAA